MVMLQSYQYLFAFSNPYNKRQIRDHHGEDLPMWLLRVDNNLVTYNHTKLVTRLLKAMTPELLWGGKEAMVGLSPASRRYIESRGPSVEEQPACAFWVHYSSRHTVADGERNPFRNIVKLCRYQELILY